MITRKDLEKYMKMQADEYEFDFRAGFTAALDLLWPCVEALEKYAHLNMVAYKGQIIERVDPTPIARDALTALKERLSGVKDGA